MAEVEVDPVVRELSAALLPQSEHLAVGMADRIRSEVPMYADGQLLSGEELAASCVDNLRYVLGNLAGRPSVGRDVPRATGAERAERGLPYAALLQAYRIGGRYIWELLVGAADSSVREQLLRAAADIWAVTDDLSAQVTEGVPLHARRPRSPQPAQSRCFLPIPAPAPAHIAPGFTSEAWSDRARTRPAVHGHPRTK